MDPADTRAQVDFLVQALGLRPGDRVLDLACGDGRHTLELRRRGIAAVGVDRDPRLLEEARRRAAELGLEGLWLEADLYRLGVLGPSARFTAAFQLFGPFGKQGDASWDLALLQGVAGLLEEGGRYVFDCVNRDWMLAHFDPWGRWQAGETLCQEERRLDRRRGWLFTRTRRVWPDGRCEEWEDRVRLYRPEDLGPLLRRAGLSLQGLWGDFDFRPAGPSSLRLLAVAARWTGG
ncbi:MAG: class I SAM-dependent methyltransferase [Acetobacteraceae bacterium]|nr:class I SAM-dependent methyltransferase [Acetobacteraceae bacterium]